MSKYGHLVVFYMKVTKMAIFWQKMAILDELQHFLRIFCDSCLQYHHYQYLRSIHVKGMHLFNSSVWVAVSFIQKTPKMAIFWPKMPILDELQHFSWIFYDSCLQYHHYQSLGSSHVKGMRLLNSSVYAVVSFIQKTFFIWKLGKVSNFFFIIFMEFSMEGYPPPPPPPSRGK